MDRNSLTDKQNERLSFLLHIPNEAKTDDQWEEYQEFVRMLDWRETDRNSKVRTLHLRPWDKNYKVR